MDPARHEQAPVMILCGGLGTRLREETEVRPKPMVEIGGQPILWHIMKLYAWHGLTDFILCLGYKGHLIKEYFLNYKSHQSDFTLRLGAPEAIEFHRRPDNDASEEDWRVTLAETGQTSQTGARVSRAGRYVRGEMFCVTYGGFFVFQREFLDRYVSDADDVVLEQAPLQQLARDGELMVYMHEGFWQPMDTYRELTLLDQLWRSGVPPWKVWA
jgi:glucose-1-phosphate cytidylyltransferase